MKIADISIKQPVFVTMLMLLAIVLGWVAFSGLPVDLLPDISFPAVSVSVALPGAGPREMAEQVAKAAIEVAQLNVDETVLRAPFDGIVSARSGTVGAWAAGGGGASSTGVVTLVSATTEVTFDVETSLISQVEIGAPVTITVDAYPDQKFSGKVTRISPTADTSTRTFRVTAEPTDPDRKLKPGMFTTISLGGK